MNVSGNDNGPRDGATPYRRRQAAHATKPEEIYRALMVEDIAATVWMALQLGVPDVIPAEDVAKLHDRYTNVYGQ